MNENWLHSSTVMRWRAFVLTFVQIAWGVVHCELEVLVSSIVRVFDGKVTTHILDTERGRPAAGVKVEAFRLEEASLVGVGLAVTNSDGRAPSPLIEGDAFIVGTYELHFHCGPYLEASGRVRGPVNFIDTVVIRFGVPDASEHYHVPLLLQAGGYATYRGS